MQHEFVPQGKHEYGSQLIAQFKKSHRIILKKSLVSSQFNLSHGQTGFGIALFGLIKA